jgi:hypothetical protein
MIIDIRLLKNFSINFDNLLNILAMCLIIGILYFLIFYIYNFDFLNIVLFELPINNDILIFNNNSLQLIGFLFLTEYLFIVILCFLLLICIIIFIIGFKEIERKE